MNETLLQTTALTRQYRIGRNVVSALENVNLQIKRGEFVAIMGPSGCGKSTLLNLLGGLDQPTKGQVHMDAQDLATYNEEQLATLRRAKMGFIFQRHDLFPSLTARENIEFPMLLNSIPPDVRRACAQELLVLVGLEKRGEHLPDELSGGQQQRVGIARALANAPEILFADEPTGNLDSATAAEIMGVLIALAREKGLTLMVVTHDAETAAHADRIVRLRDGHVITENGVEK